MKRKLYFFLIVNFLLLQFLLSFFVCSCKPQIEDSVDNLKINGQFFSKTEFVTVIPEGKSVTIPNENCPIIGDVFHYEREITLNSFSICKYEVTQQLYKAVMGKVPYSDEENLYHGERQELRPVCGVSWFDAVYFCNKLSELCGYEKVYEIKNVKYADKDKPTKYIFSADVSWNLDKNGFRLPTEAEWEFAARGGGKSVEIWKLKFSGSDNSKKVAWTLLNSSGYSDDECVERTHEVGLKMPNSLCIYDMSGNANEWCMDWFRSVAEKEDFTRGNAVLDKGSVTDPVMLKGEHDNHVIRGGSFSSPAGMASTIQRNSKPARDGYGYMNEDNIGFRLVRRP